MKKFLLVAAILLTLTGCAYFEDRLDAAGQCAADPVCLEKVMNTAKAGKAVGDATGIPWAGAGAGGLVAALMLFFARKRKDPK